MPGKSGLNPFTSLWHNNIFIDGNNENITVMFIQHSQEGNRGSISTVVHYPVADIEDIFFRHVVAVSYQSGARFQTTWQSPCTRTVSRSWARALCRSTGLRIAPSSQRSWTS